MLKKLTKVDEVRALKPGDKFTLEYTVRGISLRGVELEPTKSSSTPTPCMFLSNLVERNCTVIYEAPFVPKAGENFTFKLGGDGVVYTLIFMDEKTIVYEDEKTGQRWQDVRYVGDDAFVKA